VLLALRKQRFDGSTGAGKFRDLVSTNASVVVASRSSGGIRQATRLGVVPYGDGELTMKHDGGASAYATEHYFGGAHETRAAFFQKGYLQVQLRERAADGSLIEWIEITIL
jgi:hypothetical protein